MYRYAELIFLTPDLLPFTGHVAQLSIRARSRNMLSYFLVPTKKKKKKKKGEGEGEREGGREEERRGGGEDKVEKKRERIKKHRET